MNKRYMYDYNSSFLPRIVFASDDFNDFEGILILSGVLSIEMTRIVYDSRYGFTAYSTPSSYADCNRFVTAASLLGWTSGPEFGDTIWNPSNKVDYTISTSDNKLYVTTHNFADLEYACRVFDQHNIYIATVDKTEPANSTDDPTYTLVSSTIVDINTLKHAWSVLRS